MVFTNGEKKEGTLGEITGENYQNLIKNKNCQDLIKMSINVHIPES